MTFEILPDVRASRQMRELRYLVESSLQPLATIVFAGWTVLTSGGETSQTC